MDITMVRPEAVATGMRITFSVAAILMVVAFVIAVGSLKGKILGSDYQGRASYWSQLQPSGFLYGEGQGMYMTSDGGTATWKGQGTGRLKPERLTSHDIMVTQQVMTRFLLNAAGATG